MKKIILLIAMLVSLNTVTSQINKNTDHELASMFIRLDFNIERMKDIDGTFFITISPSKSKATTMQDIRKDVLAYYNILLEWELLTSDDEQYYSFVFSIDYDLVQVMTFIDENIFVFCVKIP